MVWFQRWRMGDGQIVICLMGWDGGFVGRETTLAMIYLRIQLLFAILVGCGVHARYARVDNLRQTT